MIEGFDKNLKNKYRNIFIVDSIHLWSIDNVKYSPLDDLVLTYDLELYKYIEQLGGDIFYLDHIVSKNRMHDNNFLVYKFFQKWHLDKSGEDIFQYKDIPFGLSLRLEFWNEYITYIRLYQCLQALLCMEKENIYLRSSDIVIQKILRKLKIGFEEEDFLKKDEVSFYFPIAQWMDEKIHPSGLRAFLYKTREVFSSYYSSLTLYLDKFLLDKKVKKVFIQEYHPTKKILKHLRSDKNLKILLANFSRGSKIRDNLSERIIPLYGNLNKYEDMTQRLMTELKEKKFEQLILDNGLDITSDVYEIIENRIFTSLPNILRTLDSCINYFDKNSVDLEILIANIGHTSTLFDMVCKEKNIPSYLIINGLLGPEYSDESKHATFINAYSTSIEKYYFRGMQNIVTLGDPRMDMYAFESNVINRKTPTVSIGASGFNSVELNSYVAVEFDFMYDVLSSMEILKDRDKSFNIIIKVRGNGYKKQYEVFVEKYFSKLNIKIEDTIAMKDVLLKTDFYISIYSQTLFEASCLGIPAVYYKKDTEIMNPPFDNNSELVTVSSIDDLVQTYYDFENKHHRYDAFLDKKVMEKYIGFLDGKNLKRNLDFIYELLEKKND